LQELLQNKTNVIYAILKKILKNHEELMLILDGTLSADVSAFLQRIYEESNIGDIITYAQWLADSSNNHIPRGIVYMRIFPTIAIARMQKRALPEESAITADHIEQLYSQQEQLFIEKKNIQSNLQDLPVLVLNGNIDFQTDFAHYYNHLFYIKKFLKDIQEKEDMARGIHKEKPHRHCC
jgi:hypothetical protein